MKITYLCETVRLIDNGAAIHLTHTGLSVKGKRGADRDTIAYLTTRGLSIQDAFDFTTPEQPELTV